MYKPKKEKYDECRKDVCDEKGYNKPNHCAATIMCMLEEIIDKINAATSVSQNANLSAGVDQSGGLNINTGAVSSLASNESTIEEKVESEKKKRK